MSRPMVTCPSCGGYGVQFGDNPNERYDCYHCGTTGSITRKEALADAYHRREWLRATRANRREQAKQHAEKNRRWLVAQANRRLSGLMLWCEDCAIPF
jgi:transposase-like protein